VSDPFAFSEVVWVTVHAPTVAVTRPDGTVVDHEKLARPRQARKPTLVSVAKQAAKADIEVARYEVKPDGTVVVVTGKAAAAPRGNSWDDLETRQ
jgi:hypothetical protein